MKITVAMDSFKGSMTSLEAGNAVRAGILGVYPDACVRVYPVADGGEGTVDALTYVSENVTKRHISVTGPTGDRVDAEYIILDKKNKTAIIEMASAAGLTLVPVGKNNPMHTTTYGVGEMICDAVAQGVKHFIIGIGGSATNDGGIGMLQALGYRFVDEKGNDVPYGAYGLSMLSDIYFEDVMHELSQCTFRVACDVENPLVGEAGCSAVFAPQKGADADMVNKMEHYMNKYADLVEHIAGCDMGPLHNVAGREKAACCIRTDRYSRGAGAAGGLGYAFLMFLGAKLESGIDIIIDELGIEKDISDSDYVITGEGKLDLQTLKGKVPYGVSRISKQYNKKVILFAGMIDCDVSGPVLNGLADEYYQIDRGSMSVETAMLTGNAMMNLENTVRVAFGKKW